MCYLHLQQVKIAAEFVWSVRQQQQLYHHLTFVSVGGCGTTLSPLLLSAPLPADADVRKLLPS